MLPFEWYSVTRYKQSLLGSSITSCNQIMFGCYNVLRTKSSCLIRSYAVRFCLIFCFFNYFLLIFFIAKSIPVCISSHKFTFPKLPFPNSIFILQLFMKQPSDLLFLFSTLMLLLTQVFRYSGLINVDVLLFGLDESIEPLLLRGAQIF